MAEIMNMKVEMNVRALDADSSVHSGAMTTLRISELVRFSSQRRYVAGTNQSLPHLGPPRASLGLFSVFERGDHTGYLKNFLVNGFFYNYFILFTYNYFVLQIKLITWGLWGTT